MFEALFLYSILKVVCQFETKIIPTASSKKFYKRRSLVVNYSYKIIIIMCRIRKISLNVWKTSKAQRLASSQNSNNNNLPTRAIFRQQSRLYNKHLYTTAMATYLKWLSLYNDQLFTMATSLYNGYYTLQKPIVWTMATYLLQPPLYNG